MTAIVIGALFLSSQRGNNSNNTQASSIELIPIDSITHGHGLAVDASDSSKVYIATHHGLLLLKDEKKLYRIGSAQDDYMGFTPHPTNAKVFFSSGHPATGGNIGFQKSEDGGFTWQKISDGIAGPVDFHALTVSPANPKLLYGWYQGALQRSTNEGVTWEIASTTDYPVVNLAADPRNENIIYAATPQGLLVSNNKGSSWEKLLDGFVSTTAIHPQNPQQMLSFSERERLARSNDSGKTWEKINESFQEETPLYIAYDKQKPEIIYLLTEKNSIYKSMDNANTWSKIR